MSMLHGRGSSHLSLEKRAYGCHPPGTELEIEFFDASTAPPSVLSLTRARR
jgi:hypothetical protein